jgi:hypothetical protein
LISSFFLEAIKCIQNEGSINVSPSVDLGGDIVLMIIEKCSFFDACQLINFAFISFVFLDVVPPVAQYLRFAYRSLQSTNWSPEYKLGVRFMPSH